MTGVHTVKEKLSVASIWGQWRYSDKESVCVLQGTQVASNLRKRVTRRGIASARLVY